MHFSLAPKIKATGVVVVVACCFPCKTMVLILFPWEQNLRHFSNPDTHRLSGMPTLSHRDCGSLKAAPMKAAALVFLKRRMSGFPTQVPSHAAGSITFMPIQRFHLQTPLFLTKEDGFWKMFCVPLCNSQSFYIFWHDFYSFRRGCESMVALPH